MKQLIGAVAFALCFGVLAACEDDTTGDELVSFSAAGAGPADAPATGPWSFATALGYQVTLTRATLHMGAVYLNQSLPVSGAQETSCFLPGLYVGQVIEGRDVDLLSSAPQFFPIAGQGTDVAALAGEVWLTGGDVNAPDDTTPILVVTGTATKGADQFPFSGTLTIGKNRVVPPQNAAEPGSHPICKQRIVSPIPLSIALADGGRLVVRADPRFMLGNVDFAQLASDGAVPPTYVFDDTSTSHPSLILYQALHAALTYKFDWQAPAP